MARAQGLGVLAIAACFAALGCKDRSQGTAPGGEEPGSGGVTTPASETGPIVVGAYLSLTGDKADFGINTRRGVELAIEEVNGRGGVKGRPLELVVLDDQGKTDEAGNAVTRLIDVNKAVAIIGEVASSLSLVGGRICQRRGVPMVSPSSTNTQVTEIGDYVFRVCFIDPFQGFVMAKFARENLHLSRVAIFKDVRNDYSIGLAQAFQESFTRLGGSISAEESYNAGDTDFNAQLTRIKTTSPEALFVPGYYGEVGTIAVQARRLGLTVPLLGGDGWEGSLVRNVGGTDIVGSYYSNHFSPENPPPIAASFIEAYRRKHNEVPGALAALGYDSAMLLVDAMNRATELTPRGIQAALAVSPGFEGVTGRITFDAKRNPVKPAVVLRIGPQADEFAARVEPN